MVNLWYMYNMTCQQIFEHIYATNAWVNGDGSGTGSTLEYTVQTASELAHVLKRYNVRSVFDAGCGSCVWTSGFIHEMRARIPSFTYTGWDASSTAIQRARARLYNLPGVTLEVRDLTKDTIPKGHDLILCRDCLQHLSLADCRLVLNNFMNAQPRLVVTGCYVPGDNQSITTGGCYDVNLARPPFDMWPREILSEHVPIDHPRKHLFLYDTFAQTVQTSPFMRGDA